MWKDSRCVPPRVQIIGGARLIKGNPPVKIDVSGTEITGRRSKESFPEGACLSRRAEEERTEPTER